ncbi:MAG TPA: RNA 2',3'-cyclic phosphodiesterase [Candidatus Wallbacteria bacterium]|nr:RNA 2',3'-cyclic phosphodiesterase [Candidatus Wallbacteria bacterium]
MPFRRLFIGCFINAAGFSERYKVIKNDFRGAVSGKWTPIENLHFTVKFLGDTEESLIADIKKAIACCAPEKMPVDLKLGGLGFFTKECPRILYLKADDKGGVLSKSFSVLENKLELLGFAREKRSFTPHVTLMRIKSSVTELFNEAIRRHESFDAGHMAEVEISLIESVLEKNGATYKKI